VPTEDEDGFVSEVSVPLYLESIKEEMRQAMAPCICEHRARALTKIARAGSLMDLWLLRPDVYQYLAQDVGQAEAARRVATFMPLFASWPPGAPAQSGLCGVQPMKKSAGQGV